MAGHSHGVVTRRGLLSAGITPGQIKHGLAAGGLLREYEGVYRVGHRAPSVEARYLAAVWACGPGSRLRGTAAARLLGLSRGAAPVPEVEVPTERRIEGIRTRRSRRMHGGDTALVRAIPVTTVARTLVDLAEVLDPASLARVCHEATIRYATNPAQVEAVLKRRPTAAGAGDLRRVLCGEVPVTLSKLESGFLALLRRTGLPLPETNRRAGRHWVDCRWPDRRLTVELDSYRYHHTRHAWEQNHHRERDARARGDEFRRYTYGDVFEGPGPMLTELNALLSA